MATESSKVNANGAHDQDDPEAIRAEIRATREDMTETVRALQEKLNPQRIKEEAVGSVRRATIGRVENAAEEASWKVKGAGNNVFETIKRNPAPAVLAAVGLGWLFMESRNRQGREMQRYDERQRGRQGDRYYYAGEFSGDRYGRGEYGYTYDEYGRRSRGYGEPGMRDYEGDRQGIKDRAGAVVSQATGKVSDVASTAGSKVSDVASTAGSKVSDVASSAADTVQNVAEGAKETAGQVVDSARQGVQQVRYQAQYRAERVGSRFGEMMEENPLVIGAAALAVGAILGFAFPTTEKESEIMGEARDRLMDKAQDKVSETAQKVQQVAQQAAVAVQDAAGTVKETVKNEAQKQNLTGSGQ